MEKNYYKELISKIEKSISDKQYEIALKLVEEELNQAYVPSKIEKQLNEYYVKLKQQLMKDTKSIGPDKVFELILSKQFSDIEKYDFVEFLNETNLSKHIDELNELFLLKNEKLSYLIKARLINILKSQNANVKVKLLDKDNKKIEIDINKIEKLYENKVFAKESLEIQKYLFKDPVSQELAFLMLENYFYSFYPRIENVNFNKIGLVSCIVALKLLNQDQALNEVIKESKLSETELKQIVDEFVKNVSIN